MTPQYKAYITKLKTERKKDGSLRNPWALNITDEKFQEYYDRVKAEGLEFDGVHVTLQKKGITYDYVAYKNKMLLAYPESKIDVAVVCEGDETSFVKENGKVIYTHKLNDPFGNKNIIGAYAVICNSRGEHLTTINEDEITKHRKVAETDYIWASWFKEMVMKTIIKKACKQHYADVYESMMAEDNEAENNIDNPLDVDISWKQEVEAIETIEELKDYYQANQGRGKGFAQLVTERKKILTSK